MTIELNEKSYIVGMWFAANEETGGDWLACVVRNPENPKTYKGWYRFRYIRDSKIFDSEDEKSWYHFETGESEDDESIIKSMDKTHLFISMKYPKKDRVIIQGDLNKLFELTKGKSWMHLKEVKSDEVKH